MFFPCLENLKRAKFPDQSIQLYDWWLGTRRQNTLQHLNPLQFSLDCGIDIRHSLQLFSQSVYNADLNLLKKRVTLVCPICNHRVAGPDEHLNLNSNFVCKNCGTTIPYSLVEDNLVVTFELIQSPNTQALDNDFPIGNNAGNASSLRLSDIQEYSDDDDIRRLFELM
ncbi:hypothetical protein FKV70_04815 [Paenibacillus ottowii]|uniref:TFIIB-type zinc ribbon-containing protein n=1 Tax=Paenibacillus ottowii TaxID=2315729 RepID=A0ABY3B7A1_9BACL|nr:hypothetical protein FKV70_04440 [Paenibacillus ottowii]TQS00106.1 hypothetical protein FKV70_04815 [Paenibacillus ottowii]